MIPRVFICPGHHVNRTGARNTRHGLSEHDVSAKVAILVEDILQYNGVMVLISTGKLSEKIFEVNAEHAKAKIHLALDLHFNADADHLDPHDYDDSRGNGCMVMHCPGSQSRATQAARFSQVMARRLGEVDKGARPGWWWGRVDENGKPVKKDAFLSQTHCPAFIPEPGYIDNNGFVERSIIGDDGLGWVNVAESIAEAALAYLKENYK